MTILSVNNLTTSFRRSGTWLPVVNDVSLHVDAGETVAIVGESGSGKSVTAMSIMRLLPEKTSRVTGSILLEGQDLLTLPESRMQDIRGNRIGMIFQEPMTSLNPVLTVGRQIARRSAGIGPSRPPRREQRRSRFSSASAYHRRQSASTNIRTNCPAERCSA